MTRKLFCVRGAMAATLIVLAAGALVWISSAGAIGNAANGSVQWDEKASKELAMALHHMHEVANSGDMKALKELIIGDDLLVTFELASDNLRPVPLRSRDEIYKFIDTVNGDAQSQQGTFTLEIPKMNCHAIATLGVCTEECKIHFKTADGTDRIDNLFGTATGVKTANGWKWVQWHMSVAGPSTIKSGH